MLHCFVVWKEIEVVGDDGLVSQVSTSECVGQPVTVVFGEIVVLGESRRIV